MGMRLIQNKDQQMTMSGVTRIDENTITHPARLSLPCDVPLHQCIHIGERNQMNMAELVRTDVATILPK